LARIGIPVPAATASVAVTPSSLRGTAVDPLPLGGGRRHNLLRQANIPPAKVINSKGDGTMGMRERFGRPLRLAIIGGGPDSWIGRMHRGAAEMDGWFRTTAGVFSSDPARSRAAGAALGFDPARCYGDVAEMLARERQRADPVDAVAIATPNDTHYPYSVAALDAGLDVVCDKPVTDDYAQACDLVARTRKRGRVFAIAHAYSAYPMTRHARQLVRDGVLGPIRMVQVEYIQSGFATRVEDGPQSNRLRWLLDPLRSGQVMVLSAIGCHAQHLASFVTGRLVTRVAADIGALVPGRNVVDYVSALTEFEGGARGTLTVTQAAAGGENDIRLRVYGEKGLLDWSHREPSYLKLALHGEPARTIGRGDPYLPPEIVAAGRTPRGHPEGLREAFANIYAEVAQERIARALGEAVPDLPYPRIEDGAHTMAFIEACVASQARGTWVDVAGVPALRSDPRG
jgi:predicted dehydrogenase